jgi:hypothetical protein
MPLERCSVPCRISAVLPTIFYPRSILIQFSLIAGRIWRSVPQPATQLNYWSLWLYSLCQEFLQLNKFPYTDFWTFLSDSVSVKTALSLTSVKLCRREDVRYINRKLKKIRRGIKLFKVEPEVITMMMMMNTAVFWHMAPRRRVEGHLCFILSCLHHQGTLKTNGSTRMLEKPGKVIVRADLLKHVFSNIWQSYNQ